MLATRALYPKHAVRRKLDVALDEGARCEAKSLLLAQRSKDRLRDEKVVIFRNVLPKFARRVDRVLLVLVLE